jgi:hypothetical protein
VGETAQLPSLVAIFVASQLQEGDVLRAMGAMDKNLRLSLFFRTSLWEWRLSLRTLLPGMTSVQNNTLEITFTVESHARRDLANTISVEYSVASTYIELHPAHYQENPANHPRADEHSTIKSSNVVTRHLSADTGRNTCCSELSSERKKPQPHS